MSGRVHRSPKLFTLLPLPPPPPKKTWNIHLFYFEYNNFMKNWRSLTTFVTHSTMWKREKRRTIIHWQTLSSSSDSPLGNNNQNSLTTPYEHQSFSRKGQSDDILQVISSDCFLNSNDKVQEYRSFLFYHHYSQTRQVSHIFQHLQSNGGHAGTAGTGHLAKTQTDRLWRDYGFPEWVVTKLIWLVVDLPLWKIWVRQLGWWHSQYMEK